MSDTPIVLSISMLVSGREEMEKSLASLKPIREAVSSELILVDTGCNPEQRVLAERYADKIVNFTWCNDFSAARNTGMKEARGEWFMYLDDDEWFDDPRQIVSFFASGEYKQYNSATYIQRNYHDYERTFYVDSYPSRLVRLTPKTRFVGKIHEYLDPYDGPKKVFSDFVHHYGYVYKNEEDEKKHSQRNIQPLLEMIRENPGEPRWVCQLAQEYLGVKQREDVFEICKKGLEEWRARIMRENFVYVPAHVGGLYAYLLIALEILGRYEEEKDWMKKAFADPNVRLPQLRPTAAFICSLGAKLYLNLKDYRQSSDYLRQYVRYAKELKDDRALLENGAAGIVMSVFQEPYLYDAVLFCLESVVRTEDYGLTEEICDMIDWQRGELLGDNSWIRPVVEAFCCVDYRPAWQKLLQTLVSRPDSMGETLRILQDVEAEYRRQGEDLGRKRLSRLYRLAAGLDCDHCFVQCARILRTEQETGISDEERTGKIKALFEELFDRYGDELLAVRAEIWNVAERQGIELCSRFLQIDYHRWERMLERWCWTASLWDIRQWEERLAAWRGQAVEQSGAECSGQDAEFGGQDAESPGSSRKKQLLHLELFDIKCAEAYLHCHQEACPNMEKMEQVLWRYADSVLALYGPCFREGVLERMPEVLPEEVQLALCLKELQQYRSVQDDLKVLESARKCLGVCAAVEEAVDAYAKMLRDDVQQREREADEAQAEMRRIISALKKAAKQQIAAGNTQAARDILLQVQQCAPEDAEVRELLDSLNV